MKRNLLITVLCFILMMFLIACSELGTEVSDGGDAASSDTMSVISNLREDGTPKKLGSLDSAPPITGVLLKFHKEGTYSNDSYFKKDYDSSKKTFKNKNAFYLEYLYGDKTTWYGMVFNYVLYVPDIIQTEYQAGGGKNPSSGNPFWWYMSTYYGKDMNYVRDNWEQVLGFLLNHRTGLLKPKAKDVTGTWSESNNSLASTKNSSEKTIKNNIASHYYSSIDDRCVWADKILYFDLPVKMENDREDCYQIFVPEALRKAYAAGSGLHSYFDALVWYFEKFYHVSAEEVASAYGEDRFRELLNDCYEQYGYTEPSAYDVDCVIQFNTVKSSYSGDALDLGNVYYYIPGSLKLDDGSIIQDCERIYLNVRNTNNNSKRIDFYVPEAYIKQMKDIYGEEFAFNGDLFSNYFVKNNIDREGNENLTQTDIAEFLKYRASEGIIRK